MAYMLWWSKARRSSVETALEIVITHHVRRFEMLISLLRINKRYAKIVMPILTEFYAIGRLRYYDSLSQRQRELIMHNAKMISGHLSWFISIALSDETMLAHLTPKLRVSCVRLKCVKQCAKLTTAIRLLTMPLEREHATMLINLMQPSDIFHLTPWLMVTADPNVWNILCHGGYLDYESAYRYLRTTKGLDRRMDRLYRYLISVYKPNGLTDDFNEGPISALSGGRIGVYINAITTYSITACIKYLLHTSELESHTPWPRFVPYDIGRGVYILPSNSSSTHTLENVTTTSFALLTVLCYLLGVSNPAVFQCDSNLFFLLSDVNLFDGNRLPVTEMAIAMGGRYSETFRVYKAHCAALYEIMSRHFNHVMLYMDTLKIQKAKVHNRFCSASQFLRCIDRSISSGVGWWKYVGY